MTSSMRDVPFQSPRDSTGRSKAAGSLRRGHRLAGAATLVLCSTFLAASFAQADGHDDDPTRPMGGQCDTTFTFTGATTVAIAGTCHLRHLGVAQVVATQTVTPRDDGTMFVTNSTVYTAANGDKLFAGTVGIGVYTPNSTAPTGVAFSGTESYRGGTGRFAGALGSSALAGTATFSAGTGEYTTLGTISY